MQCESDPMRDHHKKQALRWTARSKRGNSKDCNRTSTTPLTFGGEAVSRGVKSQAGRPSCPEERLPTTRYLDSFSELRLLQRHGTVCPDPPRLSRWFPVATNRFLKHDFVTLSLGQRSAFSFLQLLASTLLLFVSLCNHHSFIKKGGPPST